MLMAKGEPMAGWRDKQREFGFRRALAMAA